MDPDLPPGLGGFLPGLLGDLLKLLKTDSPLQWDLALQLAQSVASDNGEEANPEPLDRIRLEELVKLADLHVGDVTGMARTSAMPRITVATRGEWARRRLEGSRHLFEEIAGTLAPPRGAETAAVEVPVEDDEEARSLQGLFSQWASAVAPAMIGMQFGSLVGHLARRTLGQYDLPIPADKVEDELVIVPANLAEFAADWSLSRDDVDLYFVVRDVVSHAVLSRSHVADRLRTLLIAHAKGFRPDPGALQSRLGDLGGAAMGDMSELTRLLGDPQALGELVDTPEQRQINAELEALTAAILGYVEWASDAVAERIVGSRTAIREALRRRRVERGDEERAGDALLGVSIDQELVDRGLAFVRGIVERDAEHELATMFVNGANLPTPAEVDAPGLWIARVNLPQDPPAQDSSEEPTAETE